MDLEEAKNLLIEMRDNCLKDGKYNDPKRKDKAEAIETVLQELDRLQKENDEKKTYEFGLIVGTKREREHWKNKIKSQMEQLKREMPRIACNKGCNKCFDKDWNPLYRGSEFVFCYAYQQIKVLQELLKEE